jgi:hypothetical protein
MSSWLQTYRNQNCTFSDGTFLFAPRPDKFWGLLSLQPNGCRGALSPELKPPKPKTDHPPPSSDEVKKRGATPSLPHTTSGRGA